MADIRDLISNAIQQKAVDFESVFTDLILPKIQAAVDDRKMEIAQSMYRKPEQVESEVETGEEDSNG